jgi:lactate dehydrogenase-like 2-hydroxyacid dehydrogenase
MTGHPPSVITAAVFETKPYETVDVDSAKELKLTVTRVPIYSPHAVTEHAVALLLTLNDKPRIQPCAQTKLFAR